MMVIIMMTVIVSDGADVDHVRVDVDNDDRGLFLSVVIW